MNAAELAAWSSHISACLYPHDPDLTHSDTNFQSFSHSFAVSFHDTYHSYHSFSPKSNENKSIGSTWDLSGTQPSIGIRGT